jgi:hypothetical protein
MHMVLAFLVRLVLLACGLVFAAGLVVVFLFLLVVAGLHAGWVRLRGRPATPFVFRVDPRAGFQRFYRPGQPGSSPVAAGLRTLGARRADVTDVEPRKPGDAAG